MNDRINKIIADLLASKSKNLSLIDLGLGAEDFIYFDEKIFKQVRYINLGQNRLERLPDWVRHFKLLSELHLNFNTISELPDWIGELRKLRKLSLNYNELRTLPLSLEALTSLKVLRMDHNKISQIPEVVLKLESLEELSLESNGIKMLPNDIGNIVSLKELVLGNNKIKFLPKSIIELVNLRYLGLLNNRMTNLPKGTRRLTKLRCLDIRNNKFEELPGELFSIRGLKSVDTSKNDVSGNIYFKPDPGFFVRGNPINIPPLEILGSNIRAIRNYYEALEEELSYLYEAKLIIVGEPGAGKTSLSRKIIDPACPLPNKDETTRGIDILFYEFNTKKGNKFRVNIWDFGGQQIYHATHQFFLTKRSLYILLSDNRSENTQFNYWLNIIELLSNKSPLIIVQNEKNDRKQSLNEKGIRSRFTNLRNILQTNLADNRGLQEIVAEVEHQMQRLPHIGTKLPKTWIAIREELEEKAKEVPYVSDDEYFEICIQHNVLEKERALYLSDYLHDLGVFLHFQESPVLKRWFILRTNWVTEAVYKVIDSNDVISQNGNFYKKDAINIWSEEEYKYMHSELLELMIRFELCYRIEGTEHFIIPQLLPIQQPLYEWSDLFSLKLRYQYKFMPSGIITRLIVRLHRYIKRQDLVWRSGVRLFWEDSEAEIVETFNENEIRIRVTGINPKSLFSLIVDTIDRINDSYEYIRVDKLIPCNCGVCKSSDEPHEYKYASLRTRLRKKKRTVECDISYEDVPIRALLGELFLEEVLKKDIYSANRKRLKLFISYVSSDEEYKNKLKVHLMPLVRENRLSIWDDRCVNIGDYKEEVIIQNLEESDMICLLVSSEFIASDFCYDIQLSKAIERHQRGEAKVLPIIVRHCHWDGTPFANLQTLPRNGNPISEYENEDNAYFKIVSEIKKLLG